MYIYNIMYYKQFEYTFNNFSLQKSIALNNYILNNMMFYGGYMHYGGYPHQQHRGDLN